MKKLKVFLSYSWSDKDIADTVDNDFSRVGFDNLFVRYKNDRFFKQRF